MLFSIERQSQSRNKYDVLTNIGNKSLTQYVINKGLSLNGYTKTIIYRKAPYLQIYL